ncbi:MAG: hypothetical protein GF346_03875 [Candidatus Eisenbacteria bacterium]|nr:hypothetical protein [Candidatus Latescibacterota bacterium]MBD3301563.1 hypothetical protein [Candidatus Eisenbacteria bacterium]
MSNKRLVEDYESRFIWEMMERMGYLASTPGVRELNNYPLYEELVRTSEIVGVSSNLRVVRDGTASPVGERKTLVVDIDGVPVGFFAVMGEDVMSTARPPEGITFENDDPIETATAVVPELRKKAEIVVLMSQLGPTDTRRLIEQVPGIDVALFGRRPAWKEQAAKEANTIVQQTGLRGQYFGELVLIVDPDGRIADWGSRNIVLDAQTPEHDEIAQAVKEAEAAAKELIRTRQEDRRAEAEDELSSEHFLGADKCRRCHESEYRQWESTAHAAAWRTLEQDGKHTQDQCISCHVTGWEKAGGFLNRNASQDLVNVQCEACHGVGTQHARGSKVKPITEETCTACHTGEWGKDFDYAVALAKVDHTHP